MNKVTYRPVGQPSGPRRVITISQKRGAFQTRNRKCFKPSIAQLDRAMYHSGWVRA